MATGARVALAEPVTVGTDLGPVDVGSLRPAEARDDVVHSASFPQMSQA